MELLRTRRLLLRNREEEDVESFLDLYGREEVARWIGQHPRRALHTSDEAVDRIRRWRSHEQALASPLGL